MRASYLRFELRRTLRNPRFVTFSFGFPLVLYWFMAAPNRGEHDFGGSGIAAVVYYMVSMAAWGAMGAMMNGAGRIASERQRGWTRQLRITPLSPPSYLAGKIVVCYAMALLTIAGLTASALALGGRFDVLDYLAAIGLMCIGMVPFAFLAVALGHVLTPETIGPAIGGVLGLLPIVSGVWFPLPDDGFLHAIGVTLPSYWLVQASHLLVGGSAWGVRGWVTMAIWTVVLARLARGAWRRDSGRV